MSKTKMIFIMISSLFIISLLGVYTYRFIYYYKAENGHTGYTVSSSTLGDYIINNEISKTTYEKINNEFVFKGTNPNNYLKYSGLIWRIVKINNAKELVLILDDTNILLAYNDDYLVSNINNWLNVTDKKNSGVFYNNLVNPEKYLVKNTLCYDIINDNNMLTCNNINKDYYVGTLSLYDYHNAEGMNSYLNNNTVWWLNTASIDNKKWYVTSDGKTDKTNRLVNYGVRPVITLKNDIEYSGGTGTKNDPYIIDTKASEMLYDQPLGSYVSYSDYVWKIVGRDTIGVKVALADYLQVNNEEVTKIYDSSSVKYDLSKDSLSYYLNNTFYESLENKEYIVVGTWYSGSYNKFNYLDTYSSFIQTNVGLLGIADMFVNDLGDIYTLNAANSSKMYIINSNKQLDISSPNVKLKVRPALYLKGTLEITEGEGTLDKPYQIGGLHE